jgi:hypothetical protein
MSQFTLTPEEDQLVLDALQSSAARYAAMFGTIDPVLQTLIAKVENQLPQPVVEELETAEDKAAEAAFLDGVPHEQYTHEEDQVE